MSKFIYPAVILILFAAMSGCNKEQKTNDNVEITRLEVLIDEYVNNGDIVRDSILSGYALPISDYLYMMGLTSPDLESSIDTLYQSAAYKVFYNDVAKRVNSLDTVARDLNTLNQRLIENKVIDFTPKYFTIISPYLQTIMRVDSLVYIAINHYLGSDYDGYRSMPQYILPTKKLDHIKYDVAESIVATEYPHMEFNDVSANMLYEGALLYIIMNSIDNADIAEALGWNDDQLSIARAQESTAWENMATNNLLFSKDPMDSERLFSPSPATTLLGQNMPGRMGRYLGYRIVESYVKKNNVQDVTKLLSADFYNNPQSLINSGYSPK